MRTIKLVLIGSPGVGKTALRAKYITGRFFSGYRTTIGADFITKTLPHPTSPEQSVTLQIWDTAGQERFSSLSNAFFRGADAVLLMFDVNSPDTMESLTKWWVQFCERAPLDDEDVENFCCILVGNKTDLDLSSGSGRQGHRVTEHEALGFLKRLIPRSQTPSENENLNDGGLHLNTTALAKPDTSPALSGHAIHNGTQLYTSNGLAHSDSITIKPSRSNLKNDITRRVQSKIDSFSSAFHGGTISSLKSGISAYHTPSSSIFDEFQSAPSSPTPFSMPLPDQPQDPSPPRRRSTSTATRSSCSAETVTPSLFTRESNKVSLPGSTEATIVNIPGDIINGITSLDLSVPSSLPNSNSPWVSTPLAAPPYRGPKLFFTSAKTGEGISEVFEYVSERVVRMWEFEERIEVRRLHMREASATGTIELRLDNTGGNGQYKKRNCCAS